MILYIAIHKYKGNNLQAGVQSEVIQELESKLTLKNQLIRDLDMKKTGITRRNLELEGELARKCSDHETAVNSCKELRLVGFRWS